MRRTLGRALLGLFALALPAAADTVSNFSLDNGMQVVVIEDHRAPVVTHMVWYKIGRADEAPGRADRDRGQDQRHVLHVVDVEERDRAGQDGGAGADQVAGAGGLGPGEALEREDEGDRADEVEQLGPGGDAHAEAS